MPWQLIYTSAPRGLLSGQSGFCAVARSGDLREALAQRLEQISSYHYLRVAEAATANRNPTVCAFRMLDLRGSKYYVLTRIQPCGLDFTARTNHLAHHLVFQPNELPQLPSPAAILRHWDGWQSSWQGEPRILEDPALDCFGAAARPFLPAQTWLRMTGDAGRAAGLLEGECVRGCYLVCPPGSEQQVLEMFCESLQLLNLNGQYALRPWRHPFTTFLQAEDNAADFQWRACQDGTPAHQEAVQRAAVLTPLRSVRVPANSLVKVAREGQKPPSTPSGAAPAQSKLTLQSQPASRRYSAADITETSPWDEPVKQREKTGLFGINFSLNSATLASIAVFVGVLSGLFAMKHWLSKNHVPPQSPAQIESAPPVPTPRYQPARAPTAALDQAQLDFLSGDGPTYVFAAANLMTFSLPIDSVSRFQNLIQRFDNLETLPAHIELSLNTNQWDFTNRTLLTVNSRQTQTFSAQSGAGVQCSFDYSNWKSDPHNPVAVRTTFDPAPKSFSVHFGFSTANNGDPFRLLIVNESNPPAPLHVSLQWLTTSRALLDQRLAGSFMLQGGRRWQLQPFIHARDAGQPRYLYKGWPAEDLPRPGEDLDFARVTNHLAARLAPFNSKAAALSQKMEKQTKHAVLDTPLGKELGLKDDKLASLSTFAPAPAPDDFITYLNTLRKHVKMKGWPRVDGDDDETELAAKFQKLHGLFVEKYPDAKTGLMVGNTNYFAAAWQNLRDIEKIRQEIQRVQDDIDRLQGRLRAVPDTLDKAAHVGLFMIDPPAPGVEMIRFEGP